MLQEKKCCQSGRCDLDWGLSGVRPTTGMREKAWKR